jgi:hypothetical protein
MKVFRLGVALVLMVAISVVVLQDLSTDPVPTVTADSQESINRVAHREVFPYDTRLHCDLYNKYKILAKMNPQLPATPSAPGLPSASEVRVQARRVVYNVIRSDRPFECGGDDATIIRDLLGEHVRDPVVLRYLAKHSKK